MAPRGARGSTPRPHKTTQQLMLALRNWLTTLCIDVGVVNPPTPSVNNIRPDDNYTIYGHGWSLTFDS
jgi:hypothetical protein